jgi:hypothetical protein
MCSHDRPLLKCPRRVQSEIDQKAFLLQVCSKRTAKIRVKVAEAVGDDRMPILGRASLPWFFQIPTRANTPHRPASAKRDHFPGLWRLFRRRHDSSIPRHGPGSRRRGPSRVRIGVDKRHSPAGEGRARHVDKGHSAGRDLAAEDGTTLHKLDMKGGRFSRADGKNDITFYFGVIGGIDEENRNSHAIRSMACRRSKKGS